MMSTFVSAIRKLTKNPFHIALTLMWLVSAVSALGAWFSGSSGLTAVSGISAFIFIVILIWTLARKKPYSIELPDLDFPITRQVNFWVASLGLLVAIGVAFVIGMIVGTAAGLMGVSALIAAAISLAWRSQLNRRIVLPGLAFSLLPSLGILFLGNGDVSWAIFNLITIFPLFTAGALLAGHTGFAKVRLLQGEYALGFKGFLWACVLAIPAAVLNLAGNIQQGDVWVTHWWQPLYAFVPGIAEETWARLFFTTLCYALLRCEQCHRWSSHLLHLMSLQIHYRMAAIPLNPIGWRLGGRPRPSSVMLAS